MKDKTREAIKAEVIGIINRNPADSFDMDGCVNRIASLITAQADGVTDAPTLDDARREADKLYITQPLKDAYVHGFASLQRSAWLRSKLAQPKTT